MELAITNANIGYAGKNVLHNVSLTLHTGQTVCILGKNGAGKTTLFKAILNLLSLTGGTLTLDHVNVKNITKKQFAKAVAYVPQAKTIPFPFKVADVVLFGRTAYLNAFATPNKHDKLIAHECMEKMNITHLKHRTFTQLSGGEQQLVIIARALAQQPNFLIMDEPAASLDFGNQVKLIKQINLLHQDNLGILMATHSPDHAFMCDAYVALVQHGTLLNLGHCNDGITENVLEKLYDVNVKILQLADNKHDRKYCVPVIE